MEALARKREAIVAAWLDSAIRSYPEQTARFLLKEKDRFRNPVGHTLRDGLRRVFDGLAGTGDPDSSGAALEEIVRVRAVQDFTASQAVAFIFSLKGILRELTPDADFGVSDAKVDQLALHAFDLYCGFREKIAEIKANEVRRRYAVLERSAAMGVEQPPVSA